MFQPRSASPCALQRRKRFRKDTVLIVHPLRQGDAPPSFPETS
ncbi:hypothetical protein [Streptomyces albus]|nr:hypothetical protein [Streptomyces albus]